MPDVWLAIVDRNIPHFARLQTDEKQRLCEFIQIFIAEKHWEGCGGLQLTDEMRVTIAAQAGLLVLGLPHEFYRNVESILVYPSTVVTPERTAGFFETQNRPVSSGTPILGEAHLGGPVILAWDAVLHGARHANDGRDVVFHEFAHKLDMQDGRADGTPPLHSREALQRWAEVCQREFLLLQSRSERGKKTFLDEYGATNEAEFFAVATEVFFDKPVAMREREPDLYAVLRDFYRQDPVAT